MFDKILIANRGEIACRAMKTAHRLRISTVAVHSEADRDALHVRLADEAVAIGPPPAAESYLRMDKLIEACKRTGAQAVYPGYGFLSENAEFARRLAAEGIAFVGPGVHAIEAMGDKLASKRLAAEAGVNTIPGHAEAIPDAQTAVQIARDIGYPVMLKASAGGGGKGMRIAHDDAGCREGFKRARNEARSSFGDDRVLIEKYIERPRHIEIQVLADHHGNVLYLNERECSIQRRHQKVIEEAPSPFLDETTRRAMGEQAVALARAVDYRSAGTVEFIVDAARNFYFLEMNTRLQVEHPVTEKITGLDLVELMLRVAAGETLDIAQHQVRRDGWALEARVYAESPLRGFLPSIGRLTRYIEPPGDDDGTVRIDSGVYEGDEVTMYYDPLIAKLITWGHDREAAIATMRTALDGYCIQGVESNIAFLAALMDHPRFVAGNLTTDFIDEEFPDGVTAQTVAPRAEDYLAELTALVHHLWVARERTIGGQLPGRERPLNRHWHVIEGERRQEIVLSPAGQDFDVLNGDTRLRIATDWRPGDPLLRASVNNQPVCAQVFREGARYRLSRRGREAQFLVLTPQAAALYRHMPVKAPPDLSRFLLSPMPGLLVSVAVSVGDEVKAGQELAVIEAMKMENSLRAERDATVREVLCQAGDTLDVDQPIVAFD